MGNKLGKRRHVVDERYTKPQGLYVHKDVDHKKLRKLILESKLAPCYPGDEDFRCEHEECPICFLYYPSLNRSRCCMKGICTECFLQMKNPNSTRPTQCPFCKTSNYAVEYRGVKTKEEKGLEQIEEQRVIEAKIRMRQQELQDEEERMQRKLEPYSLSCNVNQQEMECSTSAATCHRSPYESEETIPHQRSFKRSAYSSANREDEFDLDLEDIMVMEAIWLSIQQNGKPRSFPSGDATLSDNYEIEDRYPAPILPPSGGASSSSPSGGLACAIAALAERQQMADESSFQHAGNYFSGNMYPETSSFYHVADHDSPNSSHLLPHCQMARNDGWLATTESDAVTGYACTDATSHSNVFSSLPPPPPPPDVVDGVFLPAAGHIVPECFEEQMMLAMAVSLAEAGAASSVASDWQ